MAGRTGWAVAWVMLPCGAQATISVILQDWAGELASETWVRQVIAGMGASLPLASSHAAVLCPLIPEGASISSQGSTWWEQCSPWHQPQPYQQGHHCFLSDFP